MTASADRAARRAEVAEVAAGRPVYLASPYTAGASAVKAYHAPAWWVEGHRAEMVRSAAARLMLAGVVTYSPIAHGHAVAMTVDLPTDFAWWRKQCIPMLEACAVLAVLNIPGAEESVGVRAEIDRARELGMPVMWIDP